MRQFQHTVHFFVIEITLGARQNRIIVSHNYATGPVVSEQGAVYRSDTCDQAIGRGPVDEIVYGPPSPLCGDRKRAVFNETFAITEICYIGGAMGFPTSRGGESHLDKSAPTPNRPRDRGICCNPPYGLFCRASSSARRIFRSTFPMTDFGSESRNSTRRGTL